MRNSQLRPARATTPSNPTLPTISPVGTKAPLTALNLSSRASQTNCFSVIFLFSGKFRLTPHIFVKYSVYLLYIFTFIQSS
jgi:hypothetical protein